MIGAACTCPLCEAAVPLAFAQDPRQPIRRYDDLAQRAVLEHLISSHPEAIEHKTIAAISMLVVASTQPSY
jgi:hypothetical protein